MVRNCVWTTAGGIDVEVVVLTDTCVSVTITSTFDVANGQCQLVLRIKGVVLDLFRRMKS